MILEYLTSFLVFISLSFQALAKEKHFNIYIDADFSNHLESSESIEKGLVIALSKVDFKLMNRSVKVIRKDHKGNSARSLRHINQYIKDPNSLFMVSGIHSPPLIEHRNKINENKVLFLVPWAAAAPITRYPSKENWIFRLSIDDSKAGKFMSHYAVKKMKYKRPYLILENTGWGRSNHKTITKALKELGVQRIKTSFFNWNIKSSQARALINKAIDYKSDVIFLVSNAIEGELLINSAVSNNMSHKIPIVSHWGIIGGDFHKKVPHKKRQKINLSFLQTSFSFIKKELNPYEKQVFNALKKDFPTIKTTQDILAPTGFVHAYDLILLTIEASKSIKTNSSINQIRKELRSNLEKLKTPVRGLLKTYRTPFSEFSLDSPDAHEALSIHDFVMAHYGENDEIILDTWRFKDE